MTTGSRFYTGIGSRATPEKECATLTMIATTLEDFGFILRSGGADGADKAFEAGVSRPAMKEIYRPKHSNASAEEIAAKIHPMWSACNEHARQLHGRNVMLVLGRDLQTPSEFVIAWTYDGKNSGGTRTGLVLAKQHGIPTFNLAEEQDKADLGRLLLKLKKAKLQSQDSEQSE